MLLYDLLRVLDENVVVFPTISRDGKDTLVPSIRAKERISKRLADLTVVSLTPGIQCISVVLMDVEIEPR